MTTGKLYPAEVRTLLLLAKYKNLKLVQLTELLHVAHQTVQMNIRRLELKGIVIPLRENGLIRNVSLTKIGKKIANDIHHKKES